MLRKVFGCILAGLAMAAVSTATAQPTNTAPAPAKSAAEKLKSGDEVPSPPYVVDGPAEGGWRIEVTYKRNLPEPDKESPTHAKWTRLQKTLPLVTEITVSKSGDRRRIITRYAQGVQDEKYVVGGIMFLKKAGFAPGDILVTSPPSSPLDKEKTSGDFPDLNWLALDKFTGIQSYKGRRCFVYKITEEGRTRESWIEISTKLPVKFNDPNYDYIYSFSITPPESIEPSADIAARANSYFASQRNYGR